MARLEAIRKQNYLERKKLKERINDPIKHKPIPHQHKPTPHQHKPTPYQPDTYNTHKNQPYVQEHYNVPVTNFDPEARRKKIAALKVQIHVIYM